ALMTNPRLLILDEATEGLAPLVRDEIWRSLERLRAGGQSILVIDKNVKALTRIADRHYIIERGRVVWDGTSQELAKASAIQQRYLGISIWEFDGGGLRHPSCQTMKTRSRMQIISLLCGTDRSVSALITRRY